MRTFMRVACVVGVHSRPGTALAGAGGVGTVSLTEHFDGVIDQEHSQNPCTGAWGTFTLTATPSQRLRDAVGRRRGVAKMWRQEGPLGDTSLC